MESEATPPRELPERPSTIHTHEDLEARGPWSFMRAALAGGASRWAWHLMASWAAFQLLTSALWASHLAGFAKFPGTPGGSALPNNWGEHLTARDIWELIENGGMKHAPFGVLAPLLALLCLAWVFWSGWRMQADLLGFRARLSHWVWGFMDTLVIGLVPIGIVYGLARWALSAAGKTGLEGLGWANLIGAPLLMLAFLSALSVQWWLCRINRGGGAPGLLRHWGHSFLRLWMNPVQWTSLVLGGAALRMGLSFLALWIGWHLGGGSTARVEAFLGLELLAAMANAWLLGWFLRLAARFWSQDEKVRNARQELETDLRLRRQQGPAQEMSGSHEA